MAPRPRVFLFLQGPPGPFFERLGTTLAAAGYGVHRINFNGGDRRSWPNGATDYRGSLDRWPRFFEDFVQANDVTDLVLFGDCRPLHSAAHGIAKLNHLRIHVFEEGYIRPDWVTLELDGVNGNSTLSKDPEWYLEAARTLPPLPTYPGVASSFRRRAGEAVSYYTQGVLQTWRFPHYRSHREGSVIVEGLGWLRRLSGNAKARERAARILASIGERPYFVFPLQLNSDHQIRIHSPFGNMGVAMDYVIESFARAAPADSVLVIKQHPLDNGLINWRKQATASARRLGLGDRLLFLEDGDIAKIVDRAQGVVTINSTTGTLSLGVGIPTIVLGHAVYSVPGITHQGPLDGFWQAPCPPSPVIWDAFCRVLLDRCLVRGGFLSEEGLSLLIDGSVKRLTRRTMANAVTVEPATLAR
ncbi:capsule biosynthesis protein [Sphingomonas montana]|uniref:capsule biosynthesis protein n=1 Tax=Sphingomonas montana TaxID=1843236 RepID=UPI001F0B2EC5|nr:capsular biosynthesis protein [Sphingomonas montana]